MLLARRDGRERHDHERRGRGSWEDVHDRLLRCFDAHVRSKSQKRARSAEPEASEVEPVTREMSLPALVDPKCHVYVRGARAEETAEAEDRGGACRGDGPRTWRPAQRPYGEERDHETADMNER